MKERKVSNENKKVCARKKLYLAAFMFCVREARISGNVTLFSMILCVVVKTRHNILTKYFEKKNTKKLEAETVNEISVITK